MTLPKDAPIGRVPRVRRCQPNESGSNAWGSGEDAILREHYVQGGSPACEARLPFRTRVAIQRRAARLGLPNGFVPPTLLNATQLELIEAVARGARKATAIEIAQTVGMKTGAVRKQLQKLRERLKHPSIAAKPLGQPQAKPFKYGM